MFQKYFLIIGFVFLMTWPAQLFGQTYNKIISDKDYYDFINNDILSDSVKVIHHVFRERIPLNAKLLYYKDSADFEKKNSGIDGAYFIFHYHVYNNRVISNHLDTIFTREDIDFFGKQLDAMKKIKRWKKPFINSVLIDSVEYEPGEGFFGRKMKFGVWGFSLPLFSNDRNRVLIIKSNSVSLAHYIYRRNQNGGWDFVKTFNEWALD